MKPIIVSGIKPSGELHIGNYLGMLKQSVELQNSGKYAPFYFIADYHSLTQRYEPKEKAAEIFKIAVDILAMGLDPKKSVIFIQSHVPEHTNLAWIFNTITPVGKLQNMIEYKEKLSEGQMPNVGLMDYPVLMAADILLYKAEYVPVGEDQRQHIELAREIVRTFNDRFGKTFKEPKAVTTKGTRVMSLADPAKKMSKSIPNGCLYLSDSPAIIRDKIKRAVTDSFSTIEFDPVKRPAVSNLVLIYSEFSGLSTDDVVKKFKGCGYAEFKNALSDMVIEKLLPFQTRRNKLMKNRKSVMNILAQGAKKAEKIASKTMTEVKKKAGLI
ncbi:MAG TPA: tryptophan--tRNA ligase [Candidatus Paceibacterota bacterium]|nr:tryptophan--tRNA ligase [Candidatus Paceibacterota bacterium]